MQTRFNAFVPTFSSLQRFGTKEGKKNVPAPIDSSAVDAETAAQLARLRLAQDEARFSHEEDKISPEEEQTFQEDLRRLTPGRLAPKFFADNSPRSSKFPQADGGKSESQLRMDDIMESLPTLLRQAQSADEPEGAKAKQFIADLRRMLKTPPPKSPVTPTGEKLKPTKYDSGSKP